MKRESTFLFIKVLSIALVFAVSSVSRSQGQGNTADTIASRFTSYQEKVLQEKLFVHTDKSFYLAGEVVWFKIYAVDGKSNQAADLSKVAYLEILDRDQSPVIQTKVSLNNGSGNGAVYLPVTVNAGNYKLRAYTNWMKNFGAEFFFEKNITIINTLKEADIQVNQKPAADYEAAFLPEGGNLVSGIKSKIAFRISDVQGKGVTATGNVVDQNGETVAEFRSLKFGIGSFYLTPRAGIKYTAQVTIPGGRLIRKDLPDAFETGFVMHAGTSASGQVTVSVFSNDPSATRVHLFAHARQGKKVIQSAEITNGQAQFVINGNELGEGVSSLTVFNQSNQPVCERLYFKQPKPGLIAALTADKTLYASREKVNIDISVQDMDRRPLAADMSASVFRLDSLHTVEQNDISAYLLFTSDLKGVIESPGYYLKETGTEAAEAADNLMLTHGWRRFKWEDILKGTMPSFEFLPEYGGHIITGKVAHAQTGAAVPNTLTYVSVPGKRVQLYASKSDAAGRLNFYTNDFYGSGEIITHADTSTSKITIASPFSSTFSANKVPAFNPYKHLLYDQLSANSVNVQVQNIYWADKLKQFSSAAADSSVFYGVPVKRYLLDNYTRFTTMEEVLREYVEESLLTVSKKQYDIKLMKPDQGGFLEHPLVLLDGIPVSDMNRIIEYDPLKVKSIDIINKEYFLGPAFFNGIISFRTYNGGSPGLPMSAGSLNIDYEGLQLHREFYAPVYETDAQRSSRLPDFRNLLYWSADAGTNARGRKQLEFYTSDQAGKYVVVLQGITGNGHTVSKMLTFEVKDAL